MLPSHLVAAQLLQEFFAQRICCAGSNVAGRVSVANSFLSHTKMKTSLFSSFPNFLLMKKLKNAPDTKKDTRFFSRY